jgi:hypothetical protein
VLHPLLHVFERFLVAQRHVERVLASADLAAQPVTDRLEVPLLDVEPFVALEEVLEVADMVGRELHDRRGQGAQPLRQLLGVALVGRVVGRADSDEQQRQVADALLRPGERDDAGVVARQQLRQGRLELQLRREERTHAAHDEGQRQDEPGAPRGPAVISGRAG